MPPEPFFCSTASRTTASSVSSAAPSAAATDACSASTTDSRFFGGAGFGAMLDRRAGAGGGASGAASGSGAAATSGSGAGSGSGSGSGSGAGASAAAARGPTSTSSTSASAPSPSSGAGASMAWDSVEQQIMEAIMPWRGLLGASPSVGASGAQKELAGAAGASSVATGAPSAATGASSRAGSSMAIAPGCPAGCRRNGGRLWRRDSSRGCLELREFRGSVGCLPSIIPGSIPGVPRFTRDACSTRSDAPTCVTGVVSLPARSAGAWQPRGPVTKRGA